MPTVNLSEMARALDVSLPTMRDLTVRYPDMPVLQRGGAGTPWQFDAEAVIDFMQQQRAREVAAEAARVQQLSQLPLLDNDVRAASELGLSSKDYGQEIRNARDLDKLRLERGFLVEKSELRFLLDGAWRILANSLNALPTAIGRRHNLPDAVVRDIRRYLHDQQAATLERLAEYLGPQTRPEEAEEADEQDQAQPDRLC